MVTLKGYTANMLGLSTDQKPTDAEVNTIIRELDTNKHYYFNGTNWNEIPITGGGGGGFTPTQTQLDAMNSGIDSEKVNQIATNADDIANAKSKIMFITVALATKLPDKGDHTAINGIDVYVSATQPTGDIAENSIGFGW